MVDSSILREFEGKLCSLLDSSSYTTLESLTVELYSNYIIDERTKNSVLREKGYSGARLLWDAAILKVQQSPGAKDDLFKAMETQEILRQLVTEMRTKEQSFTPPQDTANDEGMGSPSAPGPFKKTEQEVFEEALVLQDKFDGLLDEVRKHSAGICDIDSLRLRLNCHLARARENTAVVKDVLSDIDQIDNLNKMFNCLVRCELIGYMNYRLLDVFQKLIQKSEVDQLIRDYEDALKRFLESTDLGTLAQVFNSNPTVAPVTFAGLPRFMIHLNDSWEGKSIHRWDQLLKGQFHWPSHIQIVRISKKCIIIEYGVLPFFAPDVVSDLTNLKVLSLLEEQGVTKIELSDRLKEIAKGEENIDDLLLEAAKHCSDTEIMESLLKRGANVHAVEKLECSPLHLSAMRGICAAVKLLIEYGADIDKEDWRGQSPLHYAAQKSKKEVVELLLKAGADIHKIDELRDTPLHVAANNGSDEIITLLVKSGANVNEKDWRGNTPLHRAAIRGKKSAVELLLSYNADYTIQNKCGETVLHSAAEGGNVEIVELFLELCGTSYLLKQSIVLSTPLHCAVFYGHVKIVELFLKSGADPSIGDESGHTPLHAAAGGGHERITELLLQAGADPNTVDQRGFTPLHFMMVEMRRKLQHSTDKGKDQQIKSMLELFMKYGANINKKDKSGFTLLHCAIGEEHFTVRHDRFPVFSSSIVKLLLTKGANVNEKDNDGHTPIYYAATVHNNDEVVQLLLQFGASRDEHKMTSLESSHTEPHHPPLVSSLSPAEVKESKTTEVDPSKPRFQLTSDPSTMSSPSIAETYQEILSHSPSHKDVFDSLKDVATMWDSIARELRISSSDRETIQNDLRLPSPDLKLEKVLDMWMEERSDEVSWKKLIEVCENVGRGDIAAKIKGHISVDS